MAKQKVPIELVDARLAACRVWPEASHVIMSMVPVAVPDLARKAAGSIAVDQYWRLYYDPVWLLNEKPAQRIATLLHETGHCLAKHHVRGKRVVPPDDKQGWLDWNYAADMSVWQLVGHTGMPVPENGVTHDKYGFPADLAAEQYLRLRKQQREDEQAADEQAADEDQDDAQPQGDQEDDNAGQPDEQTTPSPDTDSHQPDAETEPGGQGSEVPDECDSGTGTGEASQGGTDEAGAEQPGTPDGSDESSSGDTGEPTGGESSQPVMGGSCADGQRREWELEPPQGDGAASPEAVPAVEQWQQEILIRNVAERAAASGRGDAAGGWKELVDTYREPKLDPRRLLQKALAKRLGTLTNGSGKFTYRRTARRPSQGGMLRPRNFQPVPRILVIIDTSGSMNTEDLSLGVGLVAKCLNGLRLQDGVHVIAGDTLPQWDAQVFDPRKIELVGRGGTDMAAIIEHAASQKQNERPELIVVVTDGETGWPENDVRIPVVAAITRKSEHAGYFTVPEWIESVNLY
jgi:predicted metal-dependent peptidase